MTFLAPIVLTGLAAVGLPVLIHLLNKSQVKVMKWAAMKFLLECVRKNERKMRLEDLILLLLRCLLVALLVLAFALPAIKGMGNSLLTTGPTTAMLVLDRSASMAYNNGQETRLDQAKTVADGLLDSWQAGTKVGLILAGSTPDAIVPSPSDDLPLVKRRIQLAETDVEKSNLFPALRLAVDALTQGNPPQPQIHILTDDNVSAWARADEIAKLRQDNPDIKFIHHSVGARETDNTSITAVQTEGGNPVAGEPFSITATLKNWGAEPVSGIRLTASLNRDAPQAEELIDSLQAGEERKVLLTVKSEEAGYHTLEVKTPADRIPADNARAMAFRASERPEVLIVRDERTSVSGPSSAFFIAQALLPLPREQRARAPISITEKTPAEAGSLQIEDFDLVILCDPRDLSAGWSAEKMAGYVSEGGSLLVVPGENAASRAQPFPEAWNTLLPAHVGRPETPPQDQAAFGVQSAAFLHPVLAPWNDPEMGNLATIRSVRRFPLRTAPASEEGNVPQPLIAFTDGPPALVDWKVGKGHAALTAFPLELEWTNFYLHPSFVAIIQRWVSSMLSVTDGELNIASKAGFGHSAPLDAVGREFFVRNPAQDEARKAGQIEGRENSGWLHYRETAKPGPYEVFLEPTAPPIATFAVQGPGDAGELRYAEPDVINDTLSTEVPTTSESSSPSTAKISKADYSTELWFPILVIATLLLFVETGLAHRFSQSK